MYQPPYFKETDLSRAIAFIEQFPFAVLINQDPFTAAHLPILIDRENKKLLTHVSAKNPLAQLKVDSEMLAVFHGPHAYVSPVHYNSNQNVPTWNYIVVHVYGKVMAPNPDKTESILTQLIQKVEPSYQAQWNEIAEKYKSVLKEQMHALEVQITSVEMTRKLSQNKAPSERERVAEYLIHLADSNAKLIGYEMKNNP